MSESLAKTAFTDKKNIIWVVLTGAMALMFVVLMFMPDSGSGHGMVAVYTAMLWCGLFGGALFRYLDKSGWIGFAAGSVLGLVLQIVSTFVR